MIRKILIIIALLYGAFVVYANVRFQNPSTQLAPVDLKTYRFAQLDSSESIAIKDMILKVDGINAVSLNAKEKLVGVTYEYEKISEPELQKIVSLNGAYQIEPLVFSSNGPSCPVHGVLATWEKALALHRFVD